MGMANRQPTSPAEYAAYRERFHNWGRWGAEDELGTLNPLYGRLSGVDGVKTGYTRTARQTLVDTDGGIDTLNLATLSNAASVNLASGFSFGGKSVANAVDRVPATAQ